MLRLLQWLLLGHAHRWSILKHGPYRAHDDGITVSTGTYYVLQCQTCGNVKRKVLCDD